MEELIKNLTKNLELINKRLSAVEKNLSDLNNKSSGFDNRRFDILYGDAKKIIKESECATVGLLQKRLKVGYFRASMLLDMLEQEGIIGPSRGPNPREVFNNK